MMGTSVFRSMLGRTVEHVLIAKPESLIERTQVYLVFSDGTSCELWGNGLRWAGGLDSGGVHAALQYLASRPNVEVVAVSKPRSFCNRGAGAEP